MRRAKALGNLARTQTALDLHAQGAAPASPKDSDGLPAAREVVLHAHFDATLDDLTTVFGPTGRMEEGQRLVLLDQVKDWCADSRTKVTVKPVIDLNADLATPAYEVPDRIREQVILRDRTCVFPWCTRPARGCDIDHVDEYDHDAEAEGRPQPGPTQTDNLAALCRFHHRLKTHTAWRYRMTEPGVLRVDLPHGHHYRRDRHGTTAIDQAEPPDPPHPATPPTMTPPHTPPPSGGGATGTSRPSRLLSVGTQSLRPRIPGGPAAEARCQGSRTCSPPRRRVATRSPRTHRSTRR